MHIRHEKALPKRENCQPTLAKFGFDAGKLKDQKTIDMKLSTLVACHGSTRTIDHMGELLRDLGKGSKLENLRLHREKCARILRCVIAPAMRDELIEDVGESVYSIICDESTDITVKKQFALCIRYFSAKNENMMTAFLGLVETPRATAEALYEAFTTFLKALGLRLERLLAIGTDGALSLCGCNHSLYTLLKRKDCPNLQIVRCVCHSLNKCASYASKEMPNTLEHMIREARNWFSHSSLRKYKYEEMFKALCGKEPHLLVKLSETRWLAWHGAVSSHLSQYEALKKHFNDLAENGKESCPTSTLLAQYHNDGTHHLLLTFLKPILQELTQQNLLFQRVYADVTKAFRDLRTYVFSVANRIIRPEYIRQGNPGMLRKTELQALKEALSRQDALKPLELVSYGESFRRLAAEMERDMISVEALRRAKTYCANFLVRLTKELVNRLPSCMEEIEKLKFFTPELVMATRGRPMFSSLPFDLLPAGIAVNREELDNQWNMLEAMRFSDICPDEESAASVDIVKFWSACSNLKNGAGERPLKELAISVLNLLALPLSNAVVERVFSLMKIIKDRLRNRLCNNTLNALLFVRMWLQANDTCCTKFEPTEGMFRRFNSRQMYDYDKDRRAPAPTDQEPEQEDPDDPPSVVFEDNPEAIDAAMDLLEDPEFNRLFGLSPN